jgi:hypothetical protein
LKQGAGVLPVSSVLFIIIEERCSVWAEDEIRRATKVVCEKKEEREYSRGAFNAGVEVRVSNKSSFPFLSPMLLIESPFLDIEGPCSAFERKQWESPGGGGCRRRRTAVLPNFCFEAVYKEETAKKHRKKERNDLRLVLKSFREGPGRREHTHTHIGSQRERRTEKSKKESTEERIDREACRITSVMRSA